MPMNFAINMTCKNTGIDSVTWNSSFTASHVVDPESAAEEAHRQNLMSELHMASVQSGFELLSIQAQAVARIVKRPSSTLTLTPVNPIMAPKKYRTPDSDIASPVIVDMPTGTGKTITSMLGVILFAIERREDMGQKRVLPPTSSGVVEVTDTPGWDPTAVPVSNKCIVFTPRHLVQHWLNHANIAKKIVEAMNFSYGAKWEVQIVLNKKVSGITTGPRQVLVSICDSSRCGVKKFVEPSIRYSAICFDEAGESDSKVNALCQTMAPMINHGRVVMISADFSKWKYYFEPRSGSVFKHIFPKWNKYKFGYDVSATCRSAAVFTSSERATVMQECTDALESAVVDIACVEYRPSLVERVGGGYSAELGEDNGCDVLYRNYGVDVSGCSTADDITAKIAEAIAELNTSAATPGIFPSALRGLCDKINRLQDLHNKIVAVFSEECSICLDLKPELRLIQPCLHFTCSDCMPRLSICPMCRGEMAGTIGLTGTRLEQRPVKKQRTHESDERIGSIFFDEIADLVGPTAPVGVMQAIQHTLQAVQNARKCSNRAGKTLRTMLICPGANMREGLFADMGFVVLHYRTAGSRQDVVTSRRMNAVLDGFKEDDGCSKLLCVTDAGLKSKQDSMTGLDIPNLDCVVSIGGSNLAQRMGRLCRLSRMSLPDNEKHALFVDVMPTL